MGKLKKNKHASVMGLNYFHVKLICEKLFPTCYNQRAVKCENNILFLQNQFDALEEESSGDDGEVYGLFGTPEGHRIISEASEHLSQQELLGSRSEPLPHLSFDDSFPHLARRNDDKPASSSTVVREERGGVGEKVGGSDVNNEGGMGKSPVGCPTDAALDEKKPGDSKVGGVEKRQARVSSSQIAEEVEDISSGSLSIQGGKPILEARFKLLWRETG